MSSVVALASQDLAFFFCTACSVPVVHSVVPKDACIIMQQKFGCVVLQIGITRRKMG